MLGFTQKVRKRADNIRTLTNVRDVTKRMSVLKWQWTGRVTRGSNYRWIIEVRSMGQ